MAATEKIVARDPSGLIERIIERQLSPFDEFIVLAFQAMKREIRRAEASAAFAKQPEPKTLTCRIVVPAEFNLRRVSEALTRRLEAEPACTSGWRRLELVCEPSPVAPKKKTTTSPIFCGASSASGWL